MLGGEGPDPRRRPAEKANCVESWQCAVLCCRQYGGTEALYCAVRSSEVEVQVAAEVYEWWWVWVSHKTPRERGRLFQVVVSTMLG
jgi:hypothetical protein